MPCRSSCRPKPPASPFLRPDGQTIPLDSATLPEGSKTPYEKELDLREVDDFLAEYEKEMDK